MLSHAYCAQTTYILCKDALPPLEPVDGRLGDGSAAIDLDFDIDVPPDCVADENKPSCVTDELLKDSNV